jgi:hypothetical protein
MEIIKRGTPESEKEYQGTCWSCKSVIRAKHKELQHYSSYQGEDHLAPCPVCGKPMSFELVA